MKALILGGNRFFGKRLVQKLINQNYEVTLLNRGNTDDGFRDQVQRIKCDRNSKTDLSTALASNEWDIVFDQICYDYQTAKDSCEVFKDRTTKYIFTSSKSVYLPGNNLKEDDFKAINHKFSDFADKDSNYAEAKRQAEVAFGEFASFPVTSVRFPIVIGDDDYTKRFHFHINRVKQSKEIYFPNLEALITFIDANSAAESLLFLGRSDYNGPINCASPDSISLKSFMAMIEKEANKPTVYAQEETTENHSPYGIEENWYMNCQKMQSIGLHLPTLSEWLPQLIKQEVNNETR